MRPSLRYGFAATLVLTLACAAYGQQSGTAQLSGISREVACAPASPPAAPDSQLKVLAGREGGRTLFGNGDTVIVSAGPAHALRPGDEFYARRVVSDHFTPQAPDGVKPISIHTAGLVRIREVHGNVATGVVSLGCDGIMEGDYLERFDAPVLPAGSLGETPDFTSPGHVIVGDDRRQIGGPGEFMVIDRGSAHGVQTGQGVTIFRRPLRDRENPVSSVAAGVAYVVRARTSTVRIERSVDAVYIGDLVAIHR